MLKYLKRFFQWLGCEKPILIIFFCFFILIVSVQIMQLALLPRPAIDFSKLASTVNSNCQNDSDRCFRNFFATFAKAHEFNDSKQLLGELKKLNPELEYCHSVAHAIAIAEVEKQPEDWLKVFSYIPDRECSSGFYHGVIEGRYRTDPDFLVSTSTIDEVCIKEGARQRPTSCAHAFGHILMVQQRGEVQKSLNTCASTHNKLQASCFQGVFMEDILRENLSEHGILNKEDWNSENLNKKITYCNKFQSHQQIECWRSLSPVILSVMNDKAKDSFKECERAKNGQAIRACIREVAGTQIVDDLTQNNELLEDYCVNLKNENGRYGECVLDTAEYALLTSKAFAQGVTSFCEGVDSGLRSECLEKVQNFN